MRTPPAFLLRLLPLPITAAACLLLLSTSGQAGTPKPPSVFHVQVRVIEASMQAGQPKDPKLRKLQRDLISLPFKHYQLLDSHIINIVDGNQVSFQIDAPKGKAGQVKGAKSEDKHFMEVRALGTVKGRKGKNDKHRFQLSIKEIDFDMKVGVPDGGTILVAGQKYGKKRLVFAVTAKKGEYMVVMPPAKSAKTRASPGKTSGTK